MQRILGAIMKILGAMTTRSPGSAVRDTSTTTSLPWPNFSRGAQTTQPSGADVSASKLHYIHQTSVIPSLKYKFQPFNSGMFSHTVLQSL
jgi:hypothetical protein